MNDFNVFRWEIDIFTSWKKNFTTMRYFLNPKLSNNNELVLLKTVKSQDDLIMKIRLSEVKVGKSVVINSFENDDIFLKFMEMGCVPGEMVRVEQVAPLGDPISISVSGYQLSLRLDEARMIWVEVLK